MQCLWKYNAMLLQLRSQLCFLCLHSLVKTEANIRIRDQISENPRRSRGFSPAREFSQTLPRFSTGYGDTDNMFYFFYTIIAFIVHKEKNDIRSAYSKFSQLGDSQTKLLTPFSCFISLWKHTCRPIKTHVLSKLLYKYNLKIKVKKWSELWTIYLSPCLLTRSDLRKVAHRLLTGGRTWEGVLIIWRQ